MGLQAFRTSGSIGPAVSTTVPFLIACRTTWWCPFWSVRSHSIIMVWTFPAINIVLSRAWITHISPIIKCYLCVLRGLVALVTSWNEFTASLAAPFSKVEAIYACARSIPIYFHVGSISIALTSSIVLNLKEGTCAFCTLGATSAFSTPFQGLSTLSTFLAISEVTIDALRTSFLLFTKSIHTTFKVSTWLARTSSLIKIITFHACETWVFGTLNATFEF